MNKKGVLSFIENLYCGIVEDEVTALAAQLTYYLILSFFPFLIFLITLLSYTPITQDAVLSNLTRVMPDAAYDMVISIIQEVLRSRSGTLLSFGMIIMIWMASNGMNAIMHGIHKAYGEEENRPFWKLKSLALFFTILLALTILFSFITLVLGKLLGQYLFDFLGLASIFAWTWNYFRYILSVIALIVVFTMLYYYIPNRKLRLKDVLPGAVFSSLGWILISIIFSYYVNNFSNFSRTYGSIGGIFVLLIWLYLSSIIILIGGEINGTIILKRYGDSAKRCKKNRPNIPFLNK